MMNLIVNFSTRGLALLLGLPLLLAVTSCEQDEPRPGQDETPGQKVRKEGGSDALGENIQMFPDGNKAAQNFNEFNSLLKGEIEPSNFGTLGVDTAIWLAEATYNIHLDERKSLDTISLLSYDTLTYYLDYTVSEGGDTLVTANEIKSFTNTNGQDLNRDENTLVAFDLRKAAIDAANKRIEVANIVAKASWDASILLKDGIEGIACQKQDFPSNKTFRVLPSWHNYCNSVVNDVAVNKILQQHFQLCRDEELGAGTYVQTNMTGNYYGHPAGVNPYTSIIWDDANYGTCLSGDKIGQFFIDYIDIGKQVEPTATSNDYDWHLTDLKVGNDLLYSTSTHLHRLRFQFKKHYNAAYNFPNANPNVVVD